MKKEFETPEVSIFDMSSDDIMDFLSTEMIPYPSADNTDNTENPELPDVF